MRARIILSCFIAVLLASAGCASCGDDLAKPPVATHTAVVTYDAGPVDAGVDAVAAPEGENGIGTSPSRHLPGGADDDPTK